MAALNTNAVWASLRFGTPEEQEATRQQLRFEIARAGSVHAWMKWRGIAYRTAYGLAHAAGVEVKKRRPPKGAINPLAAVRVTGNRVELDFKVLGIEQPFTVVMTREAARSMACDVLAAAGDLEHVKPEPNRRRRVRDEQERDT